MRCSNCPVPDGLPCLGETHSPVCRDVAEGLPGRADQLIAIAEGRPIGDPVPAESPTLAAQVVSFARAMRGLVADGGRLAPRATRKARRETCQACPFHVAAPDSCAKCGCGSVVPGGLALKLAIASSQCPDDPPRWGPV